MAGISTELEIERIQDTSALERLKSAWNALLENNETQTVELTYEWQMTYWKHFHENAELFVLIVKEAGAIVAIAPLKLTPTRRCGINVRVLEFIAADESNYQDFIIGNRNRAVHKYILNYLIYNAHSWDILRLTHIPETSTTANLLQNQLDDAVLSRIVAVENCIFLKADKPWEEHINSLSKRSSKMIGKRMKRLQRLGQVKYFHCSDGDQIRSHFHDFIKLHRKRWNQTDTPSQFNDHRYCEFYQEVISQLRPKGQIDLSVLQVGETPVALLLSFLFRRNCLLQLTTYDIDYSRCSPSIVIHELFMKEVFADGVEAVDLGHYYPYKESWANRFKKRLDIEIYPKRLSPRCVYSLNKNIDSLQDKLKQITPLRRLVRSIQERVRLYRYRHLRD